ncbi:hypothetical protein HHL22_20615 [Hymenobacter sp. RP-2-7]|uniref:Uncharacterized protein n=1 Tax=Hymenobacter polaris TaxID=2682546 RepID=A0A7Y0AHT4_9BACT|nr:hypothetical protein [Hymenobacter polaris]NML67611.1 hypothetical protein [Hymenobacter polaris]
MKFAQFPQANDVLRAAPGTEDYVQDLYIFRSQPYVVSAVDFDAEELAQILASGRVYLQIDGEAGTTAAAYEQCLRHFAMMADFYDAHVASPMLVSFPGANAGAFVFMQPLPGQQLPADSRPCAVGCFEFTETELRQISSTGRVFVKALGVTHPPICVHASNPIVFSEPAAEPELNPLTDLSAQQN